MAVDGSEGVVKSTVETPQSYGVQTSQGEYRRTGYNQGKLQYLPQLNTSIASTTTSTTVQPISVPLYTKHVLPKSLFPINELSNNNY